MINPVQETSTELTPEQQLSLNETINRRDKLLAYMKDYKLSQLKKLTAQLKEKERVESQKKTKARNKNKRAKQSRKQNRRK